ncbi:MAG TPA: serine protease, partial [Dongiaceae bacterium]
RVARTVGRVHIRNPDGQLIGYGTGSLVSPRLLITNNHVLENAAIAGASRVEFNFQEGPDGRLLSSFFVNFDSAAFFVTDKALDFSIVALTGDLRSVAKFGWNGLSTAEGKLIVGEYVTIIQHPSGERKQIALRENQVVDMLPNFAHYRTDTSPGSSGSPVFNDQWEMVALHHSGIPKKDSQGRILAKDGSVWNAGMGENAINWIANEGVRVSKILEHLKGLSLSGTQAALRKQLLDSEKGWIGSRSGTELVAAESLEGEPGTRGWTLPLQLSIDVGESAAGLLAGGATPRIELSSGIPAQANGGGEQATKSGQDELVSAWRSYETTTRPPEAQVPGAATPVRQETALEWLTGQSASRPSTMQEQFAQNGSAR